MGTVVVGKVKKDIVGIFERKMNTFTGKPYRRLPIEEQAGPAIGNVFHYNDEQKLFNEMMLLFQKRVIDRADFILRKA